MEYTGYELLWLFFLYSFAGWVLETVVATIRQKNFVNRGLINGPVCIIYGFSGVFVTIACRGLDGIWLFLGAVIDITVIEWAAGHLIERAYHERWWDYSDQKWNLDGYICLKASLLWGVMGFLAVEWGNAFCVLLFGLLPGVLGKILIWIMAAILFVDNLASYMLLTARKGRLDHWEAVDRQLANVSARLAKWIAKRVENRIHKAYPKARAAEVTAREADVFAQGCGFYKLVILFFVASLLGDIVETLWCRLVMGRWMSRSSLVWGPFSVVWGLAVAAVTAMLYRYKDKNILFLFGAGTLLGGAYEYLCSVVTEVFFGKIFWDYSKYRFNLGGRINLLFCVFWGFAAIIWFKLLYPAISKLIERIPVAVGKIITWGIVVFMISNMAVSSLALVRYDQRGKGAPAAAQWQVWMDEHYGDAQMEKIYPNAKPAGKEQRRDS